MMSSDYFSLEADTTNRTVLVKRDLLNCPHIGSALRSQLEFHFGRAGLLESESAVLELLRFKINGKLIALIGGVLGVEAVLPLHPGLNVHEALHNLLLLHAGQHISQHILPVFGS